MNRRGEASSHVSIQGKSILGSRNRESKGLRWKLSGRSLLKIVRYNSKKV